MNSLDRLRLLFEEQINVMPIVEDVLVFEADNFLEEMEKRNFQTAIVRVKGKLLKFDKGDPMPSPIQEVDLLPKEIPLLQAFRLLIRKRRYFIKEKGEVAYIVTRSDLDKIPLRIGFFGLISVFETHLKTFIRKYLPNWQQSLSKERLSRAKKLLELKQARNEDIDLVQCLQFGDLGAIFAKKKRFKKFDPSISREDYDDRMRNIGRLRDALVHSQPNLVFSWEEINILITFIQNIIDAEDPDFEA